MPRISEFYGIVITMYWSEHGPPHFHARYAEFQATVRIHDGEVLAGHLPPRANKMVRGWAIAHRAELEENWRRVRKRLVPKPIPPLP